MIAGEKAAVKMESCQKVNNVLVIRKTNTTSVITTIAHMCCASCSVSRPCSSRCRWNGSLAHSPQLRWLMHGLNTPWKPSTVTAIAQPLNRSAWFWQGLPWSVIWRRGSPDLNLDLQTATLHEKQKCAGMRRIVCHGRSQSMRYHCLILPFPSIPAHENITQRGHSKGLIKSVSLKEQYMHYEPEATVHALCHLKQSPGRIQ